MPHVTMVDMKSTVLIVVLFTTCLQAGHVHKAVTITRDSWGIAHVHGKTDTDTVFGMIYAGGR